MVKVKIETELGDMIAEIDDVNAPITAGRFLEIVDAGLYDGGAFFRTVKTGRHGGADNQPMNDVKIDVIQAGLNPEAPKNLPTITLERTRDTGIVHRDGVLSTPRMPSDPNSGYAGFFICIGEQPGLDFGAKRYPDQQGFAAFGRITQGMEVVRKIHLAPAGAPVSDAVKAAQGVPHELQRLTPNIVIKRAYRM
jgi:peptidyl-prolyl cis-trans isomerase A (cyclophilin A)